MQFEIINKKQLIYNRKSYSVLKERVTHIFTSHRDCSKQLSENR